MVRNGPVVLGSQKGHRGPRTTAKKGGYGFDYNNIANNVSDVATDFDSDLVAHKPILDWKQDCNSEPRSRRQSAAVAMSNIVDAQVRIPTSATRAHEWLVSAERDGYIDEKMCIIRRFVCVCSHTLIQTGCFHYDSARRFPPFVPENFGCIRWDNTAHEWSAAGAIR